MSKYILAFEKIQKEDIPVDCVNITDDKLETIFNNLTIGKISKYSQRTD